MSKKEFQLGQETNGASKEYEWNKKYDMQVMTKEKFRLDKLGPMKITKWRSIRQMVKLSNSLK